jgi:hypothetical protein
VKSNQPPPAAALQRTRRPGHVAYPRRTRRPGSQPRVECLEARCLLNAGTLDPTFGQQGVALWDFSSGGTVSSDTVTAAAVEPAQLSDGTPNPHAGKIVVVGTARQNGQAIDALIRFNPDGKTLDPNFGGGGIVSLPGSATGVVVRPRGARLGRRRCCGPGFRGLSGRAALGSSPHPTGARCGPSCRRDSGGRPGRRRRCAR